jgi:hypothetical protein
MKETVVFITAIIALVILGVVIAAVEISPERLNILRAIIDILAVVLGASGRQVILGIAKKLKLWKK